ncbi:MAG: DUF3634 family protein [Archangiaceae bacterium]|nr:DUF3634 family protein [Archangiaceae bacterium]
MWTALVILAVGIAVVLWLRRGRRAFAVRVVNGELRVVGGWLPGPMLADYRSALRGLTGLVEGHFEEGGLRVTVSGGIDEFVEQRLRNIARLYPMATFRASRKAEQQVLRGTAAVALMSAAARRDD